MADEPGISGASAEALAAAKACATADSLYPQMILDLCCGGGAIGLEMARASRAKDLSTRVIGVELNASAVQDARQNAALNGLQPPNYEVIQGKVEDVISSVLASLPNTTPVVTGGGHGVVAVLDPPRTGLAPTVCKALRAATAVDRIVFVSCNPHGHTLRTDFVVKGGSLASNTRVLCAARGGSGAPFRIRRVVPVDMFPMTPHVEIVVLFERVRSGCVAKAKQ